MNATEYGRSWDRQNYLSTSEMVGDGRPKAADQWGHY
jgi:hypothetical protein